MSLPRVIWRGRVSEPALAVPCGTCGAFIGKPCTDGYAAGATRPAHQQRADIAEVFGFRWAPGSAPHPPAAAPGHLFEVKP